MWSLTKRLRDFSLSKRKLAFLIAYMLDMYSPATIIVEISRILFLCLNKSGEMSGKRWGEKSFIYILYIVDYRWEEGNQIINREKKLNHSMKGFFQIQLPRVLLHACILSSSSIVKSFVKEINRISMEIQEVNVLYMKHSLMYENSRYCLRSIY